MDSRRQFAGTCMFAWDCMKANGTHLGTCIDRFYFGSCCLIVDRPFVPNPDETIENEIPPLIGAGNFDLKPRPDGLGLIKTSTTSTSTTSTPETIPTSPSTWIQDGASTWPPTSLDSASETTTSPSADDASTSDCGDECEDGGGDGEGLITFTMVHPTTRSPATFLPPTTTSYGPLFTWMSVVGVTDPPQKETTILPATWIPTTPASFTATPKKEGSSTSTPTTMGVIAPATSPPPSRRPGLDIVTTTTVRTTPTTTTTTPQTSPTTTTTTTATPKTSPTTTTTATTTTTTTPRAPPPPTTTTSTTTPRTSPPPITTTTTTTTPSTRPHPHPHPHPPTPTPTTTTTTTTTRAPSTTLTTPTTTTPTKTTSTTTPSTSSSSSTTTTPLPTSAPSTTEQHSTKPSTTPKTTAEPTTTHSFESKTTTPLPTSETPTSTTTINSTDPTTTTIPPPSTTTIDPTDFKQAMHPLRGVLYLLVASSQTRNACAILSQPSARLVCGRQFYPQGRIVGGNRADYGEWPWQVSLRQWRTATFLHKCGAALLNENWAITAAHCVEGVPPDDLLLRLGEYDLATEEESHGYAEKKVQIIATHPNFDHRTFEYDLALLRFLDPVRFQPNIIPICLPEDDNEYLGQYGYVTGWGRLYEDGPLPSVMQEVAVPVINNSVCEQMYQKAGYSEHIPHIFLCAGYGKGGLDSCEGDSGGPLVLKRPDGRWLLAGIISWGIGCAEPNQPGVYTRISEFREWINKIIVF
ncbi:unnamed protein product [Darwinula stevensoni]|uniref:Peptidase S1 domain-containing protein n=1 Tax=Darwinula stevensoni TaxID=69355 RepID=A0A7R8XEI6_9CRUS|nr:unnamed protein product [Darwinula stevensoni]CAG0894496.1 unnamed protein product [Darwinula stevensoni]